MKTDRQAALFLSHGSPMHAIAASDAARAWSAYGQQTPRPRAVLMVSAHWDTGLAMLSGARAPETIHDFGGFPEELYRIRYPAPGAPELAERARVLLKAAGIAAGIDGSRGLDHGAWVPLRHLYPEADVPVVQLSVQSGLGARQHWALGRALSSLRDEGVLIIASGHMTHNLRDYFYSGGGRASRSNTSRPSAPGCSNGSRRNEPPSCSTGRAPPVRCAPIRRPSTSCPSSLRWAPRANVSCVGICIPASKAGRWRWTALRWSISDAGCPGRKRRG